MSKKFHPARSLERTKTYSRQPKPRIVLVCEGKVTEPTYFERFKALCGNGLVVVKTIGGCGVPVSVVERAINERETLVAEAKRSKNSFDSHFEVWAVFDRDDHPKKEVPTAIQMAADNDIFVAFSNPCFELWGLMHFSCFGRPGHHHEAQKALKAALPDYCHEKNPVIDPAALDGKYADAVKNATQALALRAQEGSPNGDPSTTVHLLTEKIRSFGRPPDRN
jgi:hypothetical protein